jgi:ribose/xylose/arabinose/galactoside ABC-type transport system permease subunit
MMEARIRAVTLRNFVLKYGFVIVMGLIYLLFSITTNNYFTLRNFIAILHDAAPLMILASGVSLVIMTGEIDISVGTNMFLSAGTGMVLVVRYGIPSEIGIALALLIGLAFGAINGLIVVILRVNPLIATMGTMIGFRGIALTITKGVIITLPEALRKLGALKIGPVFTDIVIAFGILVAVHVLHTRKPIGRHITAIGNGREIAQRSGVRVRLVSFATFVMSGLMAAIAGLIAVFQVGGVTITFGQGNEFTAIAIAVIGGISLFGGEGGILAGVTLGALTLMIIQSGLNFSGASPYLYSFVQGGIIFLAMYVQSLRSLVRAPVRVLNKR